jgi:flavodoxin
MKTLVVYYSMGGTVDRVLDILKNRDEIDFLRLYPQQAVKKNFGGMLKCTFAALFKKSWTPEAYTVDAEKYNRIIIASPVWGGHITPVIRSFIKENEALLKEKQVGVMLISGSSSGGNSALRDITEFFPDNRFPRLTLGGGDLKQSEKIIGDWYSVVKGN